VRLASKFAKSANMTQKNCFDKTQKRYQKSEFHADTGSFEKVVKNAPKKSYKQNKFDELE
jgi:hypothetical protein